MDWGWRVQHGRAERLLIQPVPRAGRLCTSLIQEARSEGLPDCCAGPSVFLSLIASSEGSVATNSVPSWRINTCLAASLLCCDLCSLRLTDEGVREIVGYLPAVTSATHGWLTCWPHLCLLSWRFFLWTLTRKILPKGNWKLVSDHTLKKAFFPARAGPGNCL